MPDEWAPTPDPYVGSSDPIALSPQTYARHAKAVSYVEGSNRARYPRAGRGRTTHPSSGAWAMLQAFHTITAGSGTTLGTGTVSLCVRDGTTIRPTTEEITVYNAGAEISASSGVQPVRLTWTDGVWSVSKCLCDCAYA